MAISGTKTRTVPGVRKSAWWCVSDGRERESECKCVWMAVLFFPVLSFWAKQCDSFLLYSFSCLKVFDIISSFPKKKCFKFWIVNLHFLPNSVMCFDSRPP